MDTSTRINSQKLAKNIRKFRDIHFSEKGDDKRLAELAGVTPRTLSHWMRGTRTPSPAKLYALAKAFGISIQELCGLPRPPQLRSFKHLPDTVKGRIMAVDVLLLLLREYRRALVNTRDGGKAARIIREFRKVAEQELR
jgi:transcriptional regulator with XRE-family HTH domain